MGWGEFKLSCPMVAIAREGTDTPKPPLKNGWHLASCDGICNMSSTAVREALVQQDMDRLEEMLHTSVIQCLLRKDVVKLLPPSSTSLR
jgi:hypothetical protein